jgi:hypothetical protein
MGKVYAKIDERNAAFIQAQHVFFVATAPADLDGHLNLSPKGLDAFRILDPLTMAYLDLTGSGIETVAHLQENGRIVLMFCAFDGPPRILRLHGRGEVLEAGTSAFDALRPLWPEYEGVRSIIRVRLDRISDSCGFGVPRYTFAGDRTQLLDWSRHEGADGLRAYRAEVNRHSIDGLPGLPSVQPEGAQQ